MITSGLQIVNSNDEYAYQGAMWAVLIVSAALCFVYITFLTLAPPSMFNLPNQLGPIVLLAACLLASYRLLRSSKFAAWTPIPWFLIACGVYFGFGPLVYFFGDRASVDFVDSFFPVDSHSLLRSHLLNAFAIAIIVATVIGLEFVLPKGKELREAKTCDTIQLRWLLWIFLVVGLSVEILLVLPFKMGLFTWTLPGSIQYLSTFSKLGIIILFLLVHRGYNYYRLVLYLLIVVELTLGLMSFTKQAVIEVLLVTGLGWSLGRPNIRVVMLGGLAVILLYVFVLTPFMYFGRLAYKTMGVENVQQIVEAGQNYWQIKDDFEGYTPGVQRWWTRMDYANAQVFAMESYDHIGQRGETMALALYALLPRVLFPSKPEMSPGQEFTMAVTGEYEEGTYTAPGVFAEAYWNGGWWLVSLTSLYIGMLFVGFSRFAKWAISYGRFEYLPIVMTGLSMGYQPNDWFVMVYVGSAANVFILFLTLRFVLMPLLRDLRVTFVRTKKCITASSL